MSFQTWMHIKTIGGFCFSFLKKPTPNLLNQNIYREGWPIFLNLVTTHCCPHLTGTEINIKLEEKNFTNFESSVMEFHTEHELYENM